MGYKRKFFNDKSIVAAAAVGVMAISAIVGGVMFGGADNDKGKAIVDLDEGSENNTQVEKESGYVVSDDENIIAKNVDNKTPDGNSSNTDASEEESKKQGTNSSDNSSEDVNEDTVSDGNELLKNQSGDDAGENAEDANVGNGILGLNFSPESTLVWPVDYLGLWWIDLDINGCL